MKRLLILLILCATQVSCKKQPFDPRNKYLGYYTYTVEISTRGRIRERKPTRVISTTVPVNIILR